MTSLLDHRRQLLGILNVVHNNKEISLVLKTLFVLDDVRVVQLRQNQNFALDKVCLLLRQRLFKDYLHRLFFLRASFDESHDGPICSFAEHLAG